MPFGGSTMSTLSQVSSSKSPTSKIPNIQEKTSSESSFPSSIKTLHSPTLGNAYDYSKGWLPSIFNNFLGGFLRDQFYLPNNKMDMTKAHEIQEIKNEHEFLIKTGQYLSHFTDMFKGEIEGVDNTFSEFGQFKKLFKVTDTPIRIQSNDITYHFTVRIVESKDFKNNPNGMRFILFSFYGHQQEKDSQVTQWDPKSLEAVGLAPVEILKTLKHNNIDVDSLFCFSLGALTLDAVHHLDEDVLPDTVIIDRGLTSINKVSSSILFWPLNRLIYNLAWGYGLDANPEKHFPNYLEKLSEKAKNKKVVVIESKVDSYFSGDRSYDEDYFKRIEKTGASVFHGQFLAPIIHPRAQHALRRDHLINNPNSGATLNNFIDSHDHESLADSLSKLFKSKDKPHTCFMVGGNKDSLDTILYMLAPVLNSHCVINK
ncbi:MAG: hypothetical protein S4CHLAM6_16200 [Chlamydiae bacterium]|nr:hypothetical protein [Chlamydiota bacterium]